jgi:transcriptional regulator of arginine metabolism
MSQLSKPLRQRHILEIIHAQAVHTQEQLAQLLRQRGVEATQVTLSRDVRELGLVKAQNGYVEMGGATGRFASLAREFMTSAVAAQNLVVLKTTPGHAMSLAIALDTENRTEVLGTIAGDDTIFVATADVESAHQFASELADLLE